MNQNKTESKPPSVEEPRAEGLDETPCCASFAREYLGMPYTPTAEETRLRELAEEYHRTCEDYDRMICTGPIKDGSILPAQPWESAAINSHAQDVRDRLWYQVVPLGFSRQQWMETIRDEGRHYRHNGTKEPSACSSMSSGKGVNTGHGL